jgi:transcription antitermination factor NusG
MTANDRLMVTSFVLTDSNNSASPKATQHAWYAIRTKSKCETAIAASLDYKGYDHFLPLYAASRRWSDRTVQTKLPLFPGYVFCRMDTKQRVPVLSIPGVVSIVGFGNTPAPIPDSEIDAVQSVLESGLVAEPYPFIEGQRVRMSKGLLTGLQGVVVKQKSAWRLVVSLTMLQRSVAVEIDRDWITVAE